MKEILDFDEDNKTVKEKISRRSILISCLAIIEMFIGGLLYTRYDSQSGALASSFQLIIVSLVFVFVLHRIKHDTRFDFKNIHSKK